jgi:DNA-binding PadR family transcriptional regulator
VSEEHHHQGEGCCGPQGHPGHHGMRFAHGHFGPGMFGPPHGWGPGRRTRRGDVRAAVLGVLAEQPMHGYQIIQQLEERSGGMWRPSAGSVYPTLQLLEDQGLVKSEEVEGRRVYALTEAGRAEAEANKERPAGPPWAAWAGEGDEPRFKLRQAVIQLVHAARQIGMSGSAEQVEKALEILAEARRKLYGLLAEGE